MAQKKCNQNCQQNTKEEKNQIAADKIPTMSSEALKNVVQNTSG